ncbi:MAG: NAD(P)-dependent oxidoreductase [Verrucomicrobiia bacterium]
MPLAPKLDAASAAKNLDEVKPPYAPQEALVEANRCLFCFDAPCIMACPTGIDIPSFIKKIATDNVVGSARVILSANILGASCARVCPTEVLCEGACVMLDKEKEPIKIGRLQRYATDHVFNNNIQLFQPPKKKVGKKVAVIGAGPAGLGCAAELAQMGYDVTIFEKREKGGGLNTFGIAYYKMKPEVSLEEVELVKSLGVEIRYSVEVGNDISVEELDKKFDAIFLGVGLGDTQKLGIPGEDAKGVVDALEFIEQIHTQPLHKVPVGDRVAVVGCGNTAIDASTQSKRLGASHVHVIYRRGEKEMPAYDFEYELAKSDGVEFLFNTLPLEVLKDNAGNVRGMKLAKTRVAAGKVEVIPGSEYEEAFDMIIPAVGQEKQKSWIQKFFLSSKLTKRA